jgi:CHASE3 domain sensor protein
LSDDRTLAVLEEILAVQREILVQLREAGASASAVTTESLALQREAVARSNAAFEAQRRIGRLYRIVVAVGGVIILGGIGVVVYVFAAG